jgi:hypothetical protein
MSCKRGGKRDSPPLCPDRREQNGYKRFLFLQAPSRASGLVQDVSRREGGGEGYMRDPEWEGRGIDGLYTASQ